MTKPSTSSPPPSPKPPEAHKSISEAAKEIGVAQHVLRFWETQFTNLKPVKSRNNRRYYTPKNMELLRQISDLLKNKKYTIKGAIAELKGIDTSGPKGINKEHLTYMLAQLKSLRDLLK